MSDQSDYEDEGSEMRILEVGDDFAHSESSDSDTNSNNNADSTDSEDEYVSTLSLYCGKGGARSQHCSGFDLVTDLVTPFYNKWHHVLVDNAFCSPNLCHYLLERNTYMTGTVRVHRKGMPSSFKRTCVPKGEREVRQQGQFMVMKYGDRKQVTFLSTFSDPRIIPVTNARGARREVPTVVNLYNKKMGGVDLGDQHIQSYDPDVQKENYAGYAKRKQGVLVFLIVESVVLVVCLLVIGIVFYYKSRKERRQNEEARRNIEKGLDTVRCTDAPSQKVEAVEPVKINPETSI
ncbi:unnamed protein product [Mytilus coruscus]|uniref:PiggyBac transposable element-derived protein domain-containing protein n=1 Tax=Mytilus coruscus TaxID=42192 RepID=A0A6J8B5V4_MYTCO|nr:unnamed protein product [Mytilus coruscus]